MSDLHFYTSFTYSYLSRARVLAGTIRRHHPKAVIWAIVVDEPPPQMDDETWRAEFDRVVDAASLFPGVWPWWIFKHDLVEACTAVKGHALLHLMNEGAEKIVYLDPDIALLQDLQAIDDSLDQASIILTPHLAEPNVARTEIADNEASAMRHGVYNLGFIAVRNDADGRKMAKWWASRLFQACYDDTAKGIFTDQKYCDLVPGLFDNVKIERDPGYNVASWNLSRRFIEITPRGDVLVNKSPLRFYHFTKINSDGDSMTERYAGSNLAVFEIWNWYRRAIKAAQLPGIPDGYWAYGRYEDGAPITRAARLLYRSSPNLMARFTNPFKSGRGSYQEWFSQHQQDANIALPPERKPAASSPKLPERAAPDRVAAIVHAYYPELLPELLEVLSEYAGFLKLFVTTTPDKRKAVEDVLHTFTHPTEVLVFENRGRDILPFVRLLPRIFAEGHDYVLKLHTKRSRHRSDGDLWRGELIASLANSAELTWTLRRLRDEPDIGIVGPNDHILDMDGYWGSNQDTVRRLAERMGIDFRRPDPNIFVAGSMFLARTKALAALNALAISDEEFEPESGQTDGTLAHAIERALTYSAAAAGLRVAGKPSDAAGSAARFSFCGTLGYRFAPRSDLILMPASKRPAPYRGDCAIEDIPFEVRKVPNVVLAGADVCVFVAFAPDGKLYEHVIAYLEALQACGLKIVMVLVSNDVSCNISKRAMAVDGLLVRANHGWDFAAWAAALRIFSDLWRAKTLIFANDSVYGPVKQADLTSCIRRIRDSKCDFVGLTESWQEEHHIQSYFFALKRRALAHPVVKDFWRGVRSLSDKDKVIEAYELRMLHSFQNAGLTREILFPIPDQEDWINPTLVRWRELLAHGFPFIKAQLLRDPLSFTDAADWEDYFGHNSMMQLFIKSHLSAVNAASVSRTKREEISVND